MDLWEGYKQDCLYNDDGPIDMNCWDKPTPRRIPKEQSIESMRESARLKRSIYLWVYRSMGFLGAVMLFFWILNAWPFWLINISASDVVCLLICICMYLHGMRCTLKEERKEGLTRKQSLCKHWIASLSGVAIAVMLLVISVAVCVRGFPIHQLKR